MSHRALLVLLGLSLSACAPPATAPAPAPPPAPTPVEMQALPQSAYHPEQDGFRVHEWGTLTSVVGSDGVLLPGLHHEEEDLPPFVADRLAQAKADPSLVIDPSSQKMETPVTYFYAPAGRTVTARVDFPYGVLTQWYPFVNKMAPPLLNNQGQAVDRYLQPPDTIPALCQSYFSLSGGMLDWGQVEVLAPSATVDLPAPPAQTTWGFARHTASNPLRIITPAGEQHEKFLFYRGLGNFDLPVQVRFTGDRPVFHNAGIDKGSVRDLFLVAVGAQGAGFVELGGLAEGGDLPADVPAATTPYPAFVAALKTRLAARLVEDGLYTDEAVAMVDTWERSYFSTPGVRLLYLLPRSYTDLIIPLSIAPAPDQVARTMVIRVEILTPAYEQALSALLVHYATGSPADQAAARASFLALGRFAEPHLTRAVALAQDPVVKQAGESLLSEVRDHRQRWAPQTAE